MRSQTPFPPASRAGVSLPRRLRDVSDVEEYVHAALDGVLPAADVDRRAVLHAHGVRAVRRVERALPPGVPLVPVLETVLPGRLETVDRMLSRTGGSLAAVA